MTAERESPCLHRSTEERSPYKLDAVYAAVCWISPEIYSCRPENPFT